MWPVFIYRVDNVTTVEGYLSIIGGIIVIVGLLIRIVRAWDSTNDTLGALKVSFEAYLVQHEKDHGRMERREDGLEREIRDHIGKHRRY